MRDRIVVLLCALSLLSACGGGPTGPSPVPSPTTGQVTLSIVAVETGAPLSATVQVGGAEPPSAVGSSVTFSRVAVGALVDVVAPNSLPHQTKVRRLGSETIYPWPVRPGFDEHFSRELVYLWNQSIELPLMRPEGTVYVKLSPELAGSSEVRRVYEQAANVLTAATEGQIPFVVSDNPPQGAIVFDILVDTSVGGGLTNIVNRGGSIVGGDIRYRDAQAAASYVVLHELGHAFGLHHITQYGVMSQSVPPELGDFTSAEKLGIRMMMLRRPLNQWPDNDRGFSAATAQSRTETRTVHCSF